MLFLIMTLYLSRLIHSVYSIVHIDIQKIVVKKYILYVNNLNPYCADNVSLPRPLFLPSLVFVHSLP